MRKGRYFLGVVLSPFYFMNPEVLWAIPIFVACEIDVYERSQEHYLILIA